MKRYTLELPSYATMLPYFSEVYASDAQASLKGIIEHLRESADTLEELLSDESAVSQTPQAELIDESFSLAIEDQSLWLDIDVEDPKGVKDDTTDDFWQKAVDNGIVTEFNEGLEEDDDEDDYESDEAPDDLFVIKSDKGYATGETIPVDASIRVGQSGLIQTPFELVIDLKTKSSIVLDQKAAAQLRDALNEALRTF